MKRILMFMFILLGLVSFINAAAGDLTSYNKLDNTHTDATGNGHSSSGGSSFSTTKKLGTHSVSISAWSSGDLTTYLDNDGGTKSFSVNFWTLSSENSYMIYNGANDGAFTLSGGQYCSTDNNQKLCVNTPFLQDYSTTINWNNWGMVTMTYDHTTYELKVYYNGTLAIQNTHTGAIDWGSTFEFVMGRNSPSYIDEVGLWDNYIMTQDNVNTMYNSGSGLTYENIPSFATAGNLIFNNITADNVTLINDTYYNSSIQFQTFITNTSTNGDVNHSYSLNGGSLTQYATNVLNGSVNLNLSEGVYNISFYAANNETNVSSINYTFTVDLTAPTIEKLSNVSEGSFEVDFSTIYNVTDALSGLDTCTLEIVELSNVSEADNYNISCSATQTFTSAGFHNITVTATDNAGNVNTLQENFTINPLIKIFFAQNNGSIVKDYNITIFHPDSRETTPTINDDGSIDLSPINNGSLDLGNHTLQFSKLGFATENFTQLVNETNAGINVTFNVTSSKIVITIFDRATGEVLTGLTTITGVASVGFNTTTTTGYVNISNINFLNEQYQIVANHEGYSTENVFFTFTAQEALPLNIYMLQQNISQFGTATVQVKSIPEELFIRDATCDLMEWDTNNSAYKSVSQGITDVNGQFTFHVELNIKIYKTICTSEGNTAEQILGNGGIITTTGLLYPVLISTIDDSIENKLGSVTFSYTNSSVTNTSQRLTFSWSDTNGIVTQGCIKTYQSTGFGKQIIEETCVSTSTGEIQIIVNTNNTYNLFTEAVIVTSDGVDQTMQTIVFQSVESFENLMKKYHLDLVIPLVFFFLGVGLGLTLEPQNIYISLVTVFILEWLTFAMIPTTVSFTTVTFISVILGFLYWGTNK